MNTAPVIKQCFHLKTSRGNTYCEMWGKENLKEKQETSSPSNIILMIHGLGGSTGHWEESNIAPVLAKAGKLVICFDWYSHGKSTRIKNKKVEHNVDFFIDQLHEVINHEHLPIRGKRFNLHAFSMGCYLTINYLISNQAAISTIPMMDKLVLQSPWNGEITTSTRIFIKFPLALRIFKKTVDFRGIKSISTLKHIIVNLGSHKTFEDMIVELNHKVFEYAAPTSPHSSTVANSHGIKLLMVAGELEPTYVQSAQKIQKVVGTEKSTIRICPSAAHTSFTRRDTIATFYSNSLLDFYSTFGLTQNDGSDTTHSTPISSPLPTEDNRKAIHM